MLEQFAKERKSSKLNESAVTINDDVDTQPLLTGDSNEELRQADRVHEKHTNSVEGKMQRVTKAEIRESQKKERKSVAD